MYDGDASTANIFDEVVKGLIDSTLKGINATIFAYGQTASGKTFTVRGSESSPGLIPLSINELFVGIGSTKTHKFTVKVSFFELYNETVNDLLDSTKTNLELRENYSGVYIKGLTELEVDSPARAMECLYAGDAVKKVGETRLNEQSSRSHTVFRVSIESRLLGEAVATSPAQVSQLNLVDLAGSEGLSRTRAEGMRRREGVQINKSLLALSNVIQRLSANTYKFINYRDSKLTRMLQPALGGNSKTAIICTVSKLTENYQETINTILFGTKAKNIKNSVRVNEVITDTNAKLMMAMNEIKCLKEQLLSARQGLPVHQASRSGLGLEEWQRRVESLTREVMAKTEALEAKDRILREFERIRGELTDLTQQVETLTLTNDAKKSDIIELQIDNKEKQLDIEEKSQEIDRLHALLAKKETEIMQLRQSLSRSNSGQPQELSSAQRTYSLPAVIESIVGDTSTKQLQSLEMENKRLKLEMERLNQCLELEMQGKGEQELKLQSMECKLGESINQSEKLVEELKDTSEARDRLQIELDRSRQEALDERERLGESFSKEFCAQKLQLDEAQRTILGLRSTVVSLSRGRTSCVMSPADEDVIIVKDEQPSPRSTRNEYSLETTQQQVKELTEENQRLIKDVESLSGQLEERKRKEQRLEEENKRLAEVNESYESNTMYFKREIERLQTESQGVAIQLQGRYGRVQILEKEKTQLKSDLDSYRNESLKQKKTIEKLTKESQRLTKELDAAEQLKKEAGGSGSALKEKAAKIEELEKKAKNACEQYWNSRKEIEGLRQELARCHARVKEVQAEKSQEKEDLRRQVQDDKAVFDQICAERDILKEVNEADKKELENAQEAARRLEARIAMLDGDNKKQQEAMQTLAAAKKTVEEELESYKDATRVENRRMFAAVRTEDSLQQVGKRAKTKGVQCELEGMSEKHYFLRSMCKQGISNSSSGSQKENKTPACYPIDHSDV